MHSSLSELETDLFGCGVLRWDVKRTEEYMVCGAEILSVLPVIFNSETLKLNCEFTHVNMGVSQN